jgi:hypothetical protein
LLNYRQSLYNLLDQSIKNSRGRQLRMNKIIDMAIKDSKKFYNVLIYVLRIDMQLRNNLQIIANQVI